MSGRDWYIRASVAARPDGDFGDSQPPLEDGEYEELLARLSSELTGAIARVACQGKFSRLNLLCSLDARRAGP